jgi:hypothetical protein
LAAGLASLRQEPLPPPAAPPDLMGVWDRVARRLEAPPRRPSRGLRLALAALPAFGVAATFTWYETHERLTTISRPELRWVAPPPAEPRWIDDPAGDSADRVWSGLDPAIHPGRAR